MEMKEGERERRREIRIFVSSTFRDMQAEREELVKRVFPQLRKLCESRNVTFAEVDLRWGISDEQKAEGKVLPICLAEIQRCRPYFIGLLGERYGWIPQEIPKELIEAEPWLKEHHSHSVTELEILHGVLNNPKMADHAFFYFRSPEYLRNLPKGSEKINFLSEDSESENKLKNLRERIKKSKLPVRENYPNPRALADLVLKDLTEVIDKLFPEGSQPDPLDREAMEHEIFAQSRARVYIGRKEYFEILDRHAKGENQPLVILGESGSGKSALIANWTLKYQKEHPNDLVIMHFIGASSASTDWASMLRRIIAEFKRNFDIKQDIPEKSDELRSAFANWLHMAAAKGKTILIIDALNQLEDREGALDLVWLPPVIPENTRLILSTLPGRSLDELNKRNWQTLEVKPLDQKERRRLVIDYLSLYTKTLSSERTEKIVSVAQSANPLFLKALLEELRVFGIYERLDERIRFYLESKNIPELYEKILSRYEEDYASERPVLVKDSMGLLWVARRGLSEPELLELLSGVGNPLPRAVWSPLYLAAEQSLVNRSGLITFFHDYFRQAIENRYIKDEKSKSKYHLKLADYFDSKELGTRKVEELPWQLVKSKTWERLFVLLTDQEFFLKAWKVDKNDVKSYWVQLETNSNFGMVEGFKEVLKSPQKYDCFSIWILGILLSDTGHPNESLKAREYLIDYYKKSGDQNNLSAALGSQALILHDRGDLDGAMKLNKEQERICRELGKKDGLQASLGNQANIFYVRGDLDGAMKLNKEVEGISRELGNKDSLFSCLINQASILKIRGDLDGAMKLHKEGERICRELGDKDGLSTTLGNQALIFYARGDLDGAMKLNKEGERICRELGDKDGLQASLGNQAVILKDRGDLDGAMKLHKERERICREQGYIYGLRCSLGDQALILKARGDLDGAMALHMAEEKICRELGDKDGLSITLGNQANIFFYHGDLDGAMKLHKEGETICRELGNKEGLQRTLHNQANIFYVRGDLDGAMTLYMEVESICRELGYKYGLRGSLGSQALILEIRGDLDGAMALHMAEEKICRELGDKDGLSITLGNQALIFYARGDLDGAMKLHKEGEKICRELGNKDGLQVSLGNQAAILKARGDLDGAMKLHKEKESICRELGNPSGLAISLMNQALYLAYMKQIDKAKQKAQEALKLAETNGLTSLVQQFKIKCDWICSQA